MSPRTVLIVTPSLSRGGAERHAAWLATGLDRDRLSPHVLTLADGPLHAELSAAGVPVTVATLPGGRRRLPAAAAAIRDAIVELAPAAVSGHQIVVEVATRLALRRRPVPCLDWKHTYGHIGHRGLRERLFEQATGSAVTRYGAVCHTQVRYLVDELGLPAERIGVVPNAVPVPAVCPEPAPEGPPTILMAAAMRADKDHAMVLRAWPAVLRAVPDARLLLAGDGPCRADLQRQAAGLSGVEFLGVRGDVDALLRLSRLVVLASYAVECFPYFVLEAMAAARGVVSTDVAGLPEMVDDGVTGRLVPPRDPAALAAALVEGLTDPFAKGWGTAGWERSRAVFPMDRWRRRATELVELVAGSPGPAPALAEPIPLAPHRSSS